MIIRPATDDDHDQVLDLVWHAFDGGEEEVRIVDDIRRLEAAIPEMELVAEADGVVVGHVLSSRGDLAGRSVPGVAPLAVQADCQGCGVGTALMTEVIRCGDQQGWPLLALLGAPRFYRRFGFEAGGPLGIVYPPVSSLAFQVRRLSAYNASWRGTFRYAWEQPTS